MEWLKKWWAQITTVAVVIVALTTMEVKVDRHEVEIEQLKSRQTSAEVVLTDIRTELSAINAKLELLLEGKVVVKDDRH